MKNIKYSLKVKQYIVLFCLCIAAQSFSQEVKENVISKNEIRVDVIDLAFLNTFDLSYERITNTSGYGVSLYVNFKKEDSYYEKFAIVPFYRIYFLSTKEYGAKGFFAEIFSKFASGENWEYLDYENEAVKKYFDVVLGVSLGRKWVNKKGFTLECSLGGGRNLGLDENSPKFAFRGGVSFGYRF